MIRRAVSILLAVTLVALLAAACGGGPSKEEYEDGLARVQSQLQEAEEASLQANDTDPDRRRAALAEAQRSIAKAARTADGLEPPDDVEQPHERFVGALEDYAELFEELSSLAPDDPRQTELYGEANELVDRLGSASRAIEKAGYEVERPKGDS